MRNVSNVDRAWQIEIDTPTRIGALTRPSIAAVVARCVHVVCVCVGVRVCIYVCGRVCARRRVSRVCRVREGAYGTRAYVCASVLRGANAWEWRAGGGVCEVRGHCTDTDTHTCPLMQLRQIRGAVLHCDG